MLAAKDRAGRLAILARWIAGVPTRVVIRLGMHLSGSLAQKSRLRRWSRWLPARWLYPYADGFIAVSDEVADDISEHAGLDRERFGVIPNPAVPPDVAVRQAAPVRHDWLSADAPLPVVLACGRLAPQKDFVTLLSAFAAVRERLQARLIILGEGPERARLAGLRSKLGLDPCVDFPGFVDDVLPWMARADVFVLSSAYEGSPNVLVEAMACGVPVVATDCPSGPARILRGGLLGPLVPVGDAERLASAICSTLAEPVPAATLIDAVSDYRTVTSARQYLAFLGC
jgi:glycosyltransferase involved in cell wall biosynthesis